MVSIPSSDTVLTWPEFKELAVRLGITSKKTTKLTIELEMGQPVRITEAYLGEDIEDSINDTNTP